MRHADFFSHRNTLIAEEICDECDEVGAGLQVLENGFEEGDGAGHENGYADFYNGFRWKIQQGDGWEGNGCDVGRQGVKYGVLVVEMGDECDGNGGVVLSKEFGE